METHVQQQYLTCLQGITDMLDRVACDQNRRPNLALPDVGLDESPLSTRAIVSYTHEELGRSIALVDNALRANPSWCGAPTLRAGLETACWVGHVIDARKSGTQDAYSQWRWRVWDNIIRVARTADCDTSEAEELCSQFSSGKNAPHTGQIWNKQFEFMGEGLGKQMWSSLSSYAHNNWRMGDETFVYPAVLYLTKLAERYLDWYTRMTGQRVLADVPHQELLHGPLRERCATRAGWSPLSGYDDPRSGG